MKSLNIKQSIFSRIIPYKYIQFSLWILLILFLSPILILCIEPTLVRDEKAFSLIFITLALSFLLYSILVGFVFIFYKNPFMQEMKDKLGYSES